MNEDQQYEGLHMDNDYEGGEWINGEFFYTKKRKRDAQTKEEKLYGVFADSDSDDDRKGKRNPRSKQVDYSMPVGFVSSGKTVTSENQPDEGAAETRQGLGSRPGLGSSSGGLGFHAAKQSDMEVDEEVEAVLPSAFGKRYAPLCKHVSPMLLGLCNSMLVERSV